MQPFLAMITPLTGDGGGLPQPPLGIWGPSDPRPTNPIAGWNPGTGTWPTPPGQPPLGIWGPNDPRPTNPIAGWNPGTGTFPPGGGGQPPLVIWGPGDPRPTLPIAGWNPGTGTFPPGQQPPLGTWGGAGQPFPTNPIAEPPWGWGNPPPVITLPPEIPEQPGKVDWKYGWTAETGWVVIGVPAEGTLVPTPSKA
jgi:hypothetical protein